MVTVTSVVLNDFFPVTASIAIGVSFSGKVGGRKEHCVVYCIDMRIIAGSKRGMRLLSPKTRDSRPITDRVKESLFNVLCKYDLPSGAIVGDLFCGVGSLGLEALSRGAEFVTFVEKDSKIIVTLNKNIEKADFVGVSKVIRANAFAVGAPVVLESKMYGLVFVDPPYAMTVDVEAGSLLSKLLALLQQQVAEDGIVIVRAHRRISLLDEYGEFRTVERRQWGTMAVSILHRVRG
jgi:16S rRNA (guanine966-N2)-methyltransferase